jgi:hypothetical protein
MVIGFGVVDGRSTGKGVLPDGSAHRLTGVSRCPQQSPKDQRARMRERGRKGSEERVSEPSPDPGRHAKLHAHPLALRSDPRLRRSGTKSEAMPAPREPRGGVCSEVLRIPNPLLRGTRSTNGAP